MLTKVQIRNFRCLEHFELELGREAVLLGANGSGKSSFLDVLSAIWRLAFGLTEVPQAFGPETRTRWLDSPTQEIVLHWRTDDAAFRYLIEVGDVGRTRGVVRESIVDDDTDRVLLDSNGRRAILHAKRGEEKLLTNARRSVLEALDIDTLPAELRNAVAQIKRLFLVRIDPRTISSVAEPGFDFIPETMSNLASWLRYRREGGESLEPLVRVLSESLPGLRGFEFEPLPRDRQEVRLRFGPKRGSYTVALDELSDGQRVLVALNALHRYVSQDASPWTVCLDEPDNFLSLAEIQPFLVALEATPNVQIVVASHHPEVVDHLGSHAGILFRRDGAMGAQAAAFEAPEGPPLSASALLLRGLVDGA